MPHSDLTQNLIKIAVSQINAIAESQAKILLQMIEIAKSLPEYPVVIEMAGVDENLAAQLIAEIGDIMRYERRQSLSGYAGIDSPPNQSGQYNQQGKRVTKNGSSRLRRILFLVIVIIISPFINRIYHHYSFIPSDIAADKTLIIFICPYNHDLSFICHYVMVYAVAFIGFYVYIILLIVDY
jgi:hypothetical protein